MNKKCWEKTSYTIVPIPFWRALKEKLHCNEKPRHTQLFIQCNSYRVWFCYHISFNEIYENRWIKILNSPPEKSYFIRLSQVSFSGLAELQQKQLKNIQNIVGDRSFPLAFYTLKKVGPYLKLNNSKCTQFCIQYDCFTLPDLVRTSRLAQIRRGNRGWELTSYSPTTEFCLSLKAFFRNHYMVSLLPHSIA